VDGDGDKTERAGAVSERGSAMDERRQDKDTAKAKSEDEDTVTGTQAHGQGYGP
jgi:hypothetical protein